MPSAALPSIFTTRCMYSSVDSVIGWINLRTGARNTLSSDSNSGQMQQIARRHAVRAVVYRLIAPSSPCGAYSSVDVLGQHHPPSNQCSLIVAR